MADERIEIVIEGQDKLSGPARSATSALGGLERGSRSASGAVGGLGSVLANAAASAGGFLAAMGAMRALDAVTGAVGGLVSNMIGLNAAQESLQISFGVLLSDAAAKTSNVSMSAGEMAEVTGTAANSVRDAHERMGDAVEDHTLRLGKLTAEYDSLAQDAADKLAELAKDFTTANADMSYSHSQALAGMRRQLEDLDRAYASSSSDRRRRFEQETADRQRRYQEEARTAPDRFLREKEASARNAEFLQAAIDEEAAKGTAADRTLLASLRQRLNQEQTAQQQTFAQFQAQQQRQQAEEEKAAKARYEQEEGLATASHGRQVEALRRRLGEEEAEFSRSLAKRQEKYAEDVANAKQAEAEKAAALQDRLAEEERQYARVTRDAQQAIAAAGASYGKALAKTQQQSGASVNQLGDLYKNLGAFVGRELTSAEDRAAAMFQFIEQKAKESPFTLPQMEEAAKRLVAYRLDATKFLDTVGDVAAGMNVPLEQVADAFGRLSSGQMGEAMEAFRRFSVNLRDIEGLKFDGQGALVTPVNEALDIVQAALGERFGGMQAKLAEGWRGLTSMIDDAWTRFQRTLGRPLFDELKGHLKELVGWIDENEQAVMGFARDLGRGLGDTVKALIPAAQGALTGVFEWVKSGDAKRQFDDFVTTGRTVVVFLSDTAKWVDRNRGLFEGLGRTMGIVADILSGRFIGSIASVTAGWGALVGQTIRPDLDRLGTWFGELAKGIGETWQGIETTIRGAWNNIIDIGRTAVNALLGLLNEIIKGWNALKFELPKIDIAGQTFGGYTVGVPQIAGLPLIPTPKVPVMDQGGIATRPTLAALAMNGRPEAVVPLSGGNVIDYDRLAAAMARQPIAVYLDGERIALATRQHLQARGAGGMGF